MEEEGIGSAITLPCFVLEYSPPWLLCSLIFLIRSSCLLKDVESKLFDWEGKGP